MASLRKHLLSVLVEEASEDVHMDTGIVNSYFKLQTKRRLTSSLLFSDLIESESKRRRFPAKIDNYVVDVVHHYDDLDFRSHFRMNRSSVETLINQIAPLTPCRTVNMETKTLAFIWTLANQESFRGVGDRFKLEKGQLQRIFLSVCDSVNHIKHQYISWPTMQEAYINMQEFEESWGFPNAVGAIDGTDIPIKPPQATRDSYINRKGHPAIKTQAVCNHRMEFIDVFSGWAGSVHDARMFRNSPLAEKLSDPPNDLMPANSHILGDAAYPLQLGLMTPFRDNGHLSESQKKYNRVHSSARQVIERSFALLKGKWRRLKYLDMDLVEKIPNVIMAACVLHNLIIKLERREETEFEEGDNNVNDGCVLAHNEPRGTAAVNKRKLIVDSL